MMHKWALVLLRFGANCFPPLHAEGPFRGTDHDLPQSLAVQSNLRPSFQALMTQERGYALATETWKDYSKILKMMETQAWED